MSRAVHVLLSALVFYAVFGAQASDTLLISDIDDTIRRTHVRAKGIDLLGTAAAAKKTRNAFSGMATLYSWLAPSTIFAYVSAAPFPISYFSEKFLHDSGFPCGDFRSRPSLWISSYDFKVAAVEEIISLHQPKKMILVGDNSERDIEVYREIRARWRAGRFASVSELDIYIHHVADLPGAHQAPSGINYFVTAAELAAKLLPAQEAELVFAEVAADLSHDYFRVFPRWLQCSSLPPVEWPEVELSSQGQREYELIKKVSAHECSDEFVPSLTSNL